MKKIKGIALVLAMVLIIGQISVDLLAQDQVQEEVELDEILNEEEVVEELKPEEIEQAYLGNAYATVIASEPTLEVGRIAQFQLYINLDGRQTSYKNVLVQVSLPSQIDQKEILFQQDLNELKIRGVVPQYDQENKVLNYYFEELEGGFETSLLLNIETVNGSSLNNDVLTTKLQVVADEALLASDEAQIVLVANQNMSLSNKLKGILVNDELIDRLSIKYMDTAIFTVGSSINKFTSGSLALLPESKVIITYTLAEGLTYLSDTSGVTPVQNGQTLTWEFAYNANEDESYFYTTNFDISVLVDGDLTVFSKIKNTASATATFIDNTVQTYNADATVIVSPNFEYELEGLYDGSAYTTIFSGPSDGLGNTGWINNDDPEVTDGGLLGWGLYLTSLYSVHPTEGLNAYNVFFHPDENTNISQIYSGDYYYRPSSAFAEAGLQPLEEKIYASVSIKYFDSEEWYQGFDKIEASTYYYPNQLGIDPNRKVESLWFHYHDGETHVFWDDIGFGNVQDSAVNTIPAGMTTTNFRIWTTIDEGYVGSIESNVALAFSGWNINGNRIDMQSKNVPEELKISWYQDFDAGSESRLLPKTAQVVEPPVGVERYVRSNAHFANTENNLLNEGNNILKLELINDSASVSALKGPFEAYVLVDEGIEFNDLSGVVGGEVKLITDNYKNTGKTLLHLVYSSTNITISYKSTVSIPVTVTSRSPYNVNVEMYGYLNDDFEVSDVSNTNGTFTQKELDTEDFNDNGLIEELFVTRNQYTFIDAYEFYGTLSASHDDVTFSNSINVYDDGFNMMRIGIYNPNQKPISDLVLIGVLPTVDDTYVLNDVVRNSKFSMSFSEPFPLSEAMAESFEITYSSSKEPLVEGVLDANTSSNLPLITSPSRVDDQLWLKADEVKDFSTIRSYKIVLKSDAKAIRDQEIEFKVPLVMDDHDLVGDENIDERIAFSSYAVGINNASVFETQLLNLIYTKKPVYNINANDVIMKLDDVKKMQADKTLEAYVKEKAIPYVTKDGNLLIEPNILMTILNKPENFEVGSYDLQFSFDPQLEAVGVVTVNTKLIIVDNDELVPDEPIKPDLPQKPDESKDVETGVKDYSVSYMIVIVFATLGVLGLQKRRRSN